MKTSILAHIGCSLALSFSIQTSNAAMRLDAQIVDQATGMPLAARVAITNAQGKFVEIEGQHEHVNYLGKRWCYVDGSFALPVPEAAIGIEIRRGFETRPFWVSLESEGDAQTINRTFRLRRWSDLRQKGYVNGDIHAHLPIPPEAHAQMRAEDLNTLSLLHLANSAYQLPLNDFFSGELDSRSTRGASSMSARKSAISRWAT
jgi:hypothetical protein